MTNAAQKHAIAAGFGGLHMTHFDRRRLVLAGVAALLDTRSLSAQSGATFTYRGITVDTSAAQDLPNLKEIVASLKHQIDIVVDCGAKPEIMTFFKVRRFRSSPDRAMVADISRPRSRASRLMRPPDAYALKNAGILCRDKKPLSLGQRRPSAQRPHRAA
ncbi:hypothetical protein ABIB73_002351 [Bradyrhizobium sp. F1.4.3]|uniref:hypothetical protein n=1 Tax=Bradyrhizobium sp. F1.4.3 TaxID=3156356 RepID=UPI00339A41E1